MGVRAIVNDFALAGVATVHKGTVIGFVEPSGLLRRFLQPLCDRTSSSVLMAQQQ